MINALIVIQRDPTGKNVRPKPQMEYSKDGSKVLEMRLKKKKYTRTGEGRIGMAGACGKNKRKREKSLGFLINCVFKVTRRCNTGTGKSNVGLDEGGQACTTQCSPPSLPYPGESFVKTERANLSPNRKGQFQA